MFRDLKEYQEIAKIYTDKVSKPEDLEENQANRMKMKATRDANKPKTRAEVGLPPKKKPSPFERKFGKERNEKRMISQGVKKPMPTTAEIRAKNPNVVPGTRVNEIGQKSDKPSEGDFKKDFPDKPKISKFTKQGKPRTKAQMMAAKRIGSGTAKNPDTTIAQVKQKNQDDMRARAKAKFEAFKKRREEKKASMANEENKMPNAEVNEMKSNPDFVGVGANKKYKEKDSGTTSYNKINVNYEPGLGKTGNATVMKGGAYSSKFGKDNPIGTSEDDRIAMGKEQKKKIAAMKPKMEEFTPYDIVLEYLLSTEQAATIEEANYVMTEMDAETIQGIVEMQGQINRADIIGGTQAAKNAAAGKGKYTPGKGVTKDFKLDPSFKLPKA